MGEKKKSILTCLIYKFSGFPIYFGWGRVLQKIVCQNLNKLKGLDVFLLGKFCFPWYLYKKKKKSFVLDALHTLLRTKSADLCGLLGGQRTLEFYFIFFFFSQGFDSEWFSHDSHQEKFSLLPFLLLSVVEVRCKWLCCWHFSPREKFKSHLGHFLGLRALWMLRGLSWTIFGLYGSWERSVLISYSWCSAKVKSPPTPQPVCASAEIISHLKALQALCPAASWLHFFNLIAFVSSLTMNIHFSAACRFIEQARKSKERRRNTNEVLKNQNFDWNNWFFNFVWGEKKKKEKRIFEKSSSSPPSLLLLADRREWLWFPWRCLWAHGFMKR